MISVALDAADRDRSKSYIIYPENYRLTFNFIVYPGNLSNFLKLKIDKASAVRTMYFCIRWI